ncbi:Electron transfer flavoprotein subunit alpha, mitochondrial [Dendrobium catenatum]|uniref:Electron transfer flavoprotein subunit alpha, mitochondrial n=1 Tax=Dendrobium catenatum TaxID=906689 RepID=A0A2I0VVV5_9ASPA|nr:Electron transfer flavoprotein subunit alpha, mitochondrial [Dendrobium catenatum]
MNVRESSWDDDDWNDDWKIDYSLAMVELVKAAFCFNGISCHLQSSEESPLLFDFSFCNPLLSVDFQTCFLLKSEKKIALNVERMDGKGCTYGCGQYGMGCGGKVEGGELRIAEGEQKLVIQSYLMLQVLVADANILMHPLAEPWADLVHLLQKKGAYSYIISASSSFGKNVLPRAAAILDVSPITDVIEISEPYLFVRPIYAGNALCTVRYTGLEPCMVTIRSTSFPPPSIPTAVESSAGCAAPISQVDLSTFYKETGGKSRWLKLTSQETDRPDLGNARIIVTGGRGLKSAENFKLLDKLAEKLGAAVGATRAAVDANFVPNDLQVGQTGKIVAPELYMAFGVSGAIQHLAGMRDSKVIVAVNKDPDAPIFQVTKNIMSSFLISFCSRRLHGLVAVLFEAIPRVDRKCPKKKTLAGQH